MNDLTGSPLVDPLEYDQETDTYRARYDWSCSVPLTTAVVEVVAEVVDVDPRDVSRLYPAVDPEALDSLFEPVPAAEDRREGQVSFVVDDHRVTVRGTGDIKVQPRTRSD